MAIQDGQLDFTEITHSEKGLVPVGGVIYSFPHLSGAYQPPASGQVKDGWMRPDGSVVPAGYALEGVTLPDFSAKRFLAGSTAASNSSLGKNTAETKGSVETGYDTASHDHNMKHGHWHSYIDSNGSYETYKAKRNYESGRNSSNTELAFIRKDRNDGDQTLFNEDNKPEHFYIGQVENAPRGGDGSSASTGLNDIYFSIGPSSGISFSGDSYSNLPEHVECFVLIRVD